MRAYRNVVYRSIWPNIDMRVAEGQDLLKSEYLLQPGADPIAIRVDYDGIEALRLARDGSLEIHTAFGVLRESPPDIYQIIAGRRVQIEGGFRLFDTTSYGFYLGGYDTDVPVVIDPELEWSHYLGGSGKNARLAEGYGDIVLDVAVDSSGSVYVTGVTTSVDFPGVDPPRSHYLGAEDVFVAKLDPAGSVVFATYLGSKAYDSGHAVAVDASGNIYIAGTTGGAFPTTPNVAQSKRGIETVFVAKLDAGGAVTYSTMLGGRGDQTGFGIAVDKDGNAYVVGETNSVDFPVQTPFQGSLAGAPDKGAYQSRELDAFVTKVSSDGSRFIYSTYLGGSGTERASDLVVGGDGSAYLTGFTDSMDFPTRGAVQGVRRGGRDAFVVRIASDGQSLEYSTYLGGARADVAVAIDVDGTGRSWVTGSTESDDFPVARPLQPTRSGAEGADRFRDAFIASLSSSGSSLEYGTYIGGELNDAGTALALDMAGSVYVTGRTFSSDFPTLGAALPAKAGSGDAFIVKVNGQSGKLLYSTPVGGSLVDEPFGIAVDREDAVYVGGATKSPDFPSANNGRRGEDDGFVAKFSPQPTIPNVRPGAAPHVWADIVGRQRIRSGRPQSLTVFFGNSGSADAYGVPLWIDGIPADATWELDIKVRPPRTSIKGEELYLKKFPLEVRSGSSLVLPLLIPLIPAGATGSFTLTITVPSDRTFELRAWTDPPYFSSPLSDAMTGCLTKVLVDIFTEDILPAGIPFPVKCQNMVREIALEWFERMPDSFFSSPGQQAPSIYSNLAFIAAIVETGVTCALEVAGQVQPAWQIGELLGATLEVMGDLADKSEKVAACVEEFTKGRGSSSGGGHYGSSSPGVEWPMESSSSVDPNEKAGSAGKGGSAWVSTRDGLRYVISFENLEGATAPAQTVVVEDHLNAQVDLDTFSLGPIAFGSQRLIPPPGTVDFHQVVNLQADQTLAVDVDVRLNRESGTVTWRLQTVDRQTGQTPADPLAGFLPPNKIPPKGEGSVSFTIRARGMPATGTEVRNGASITFDQNPPILAPEWMNTIDGDGPQSTVRSVDQQQSGRLRVRWGGSDQGSGIASYTIFVSENGGPFRVWLTSASTEGSFTATQGSSYEFYSSAMDRVGNAEIEPRSGEQAAFRFGYRASGWFSVAAVALLLLATATMAWLFIARRRRRRPRTKTRQ